MESNGGVLLVDDDPAFLRSLGRLLEGAGISPVQAVPDGRRVLEKVESMQPDAICLDLGLDGVDGRKILSQLRSDWPEIGVVVVTGVHDLDVAVDCMRSGACDYLPKPFHPESLLQAVRKIRQDAVSRRESGSSSGCAAQEGLEHPEAFAEMLTGSSVMREVFLYAESVAASSLPILVTGETGTGKELMARALHRLRDPDLPFVAVNTAGLDDAMFSDTLFGHVGGAFTGADRARSGLVEEAGQGTLFLDEIGDLSPVSQVKLLRLLQENEYLPVGSDKCRRSRCRFVLATHRDLSVDQGFRKDLFWRLRSHHIHIPPLRQRREDVAVLCRHFAAEAARDMGRERAEPSDAFLDDLRRMDFPGNVRELRGLVHDQVARNRGPRLEMVRAVGAARDPVLSMDSFPTLSELQARHIVQALERTGGNRTAAAEMLGISRQTLITHLKKESAPCRRES
jgi:DNA-binding NtrC family response regulator